MKIPQIETPVTGIPLADRPGRTAGLSGTPTRLFVVLFCLSLLAGCSTVKGWFGGKPGSKAAEPAELVVFTPTVSVSKIWSVQLGKGEGRLGARQGPAVLDGRVYGSAITGGVRALDLQTGAVVWHYESKLKLSGGPGVGDGLVVVGGLEGNVIALDAATGTEKWTAKVNNEVIAAPAIGQGLVVVRANDGRVTAFDAATGERRWFWNHDLPTLTVRGNDAPVMGPGLVFVGNDDGTLAALAIADGRMLWTQAVSQPEGRTELDRMADVDGTPVLDGTTLFGSSYKRDTLAIEAPTGRPIWTRNVGGANRVGVSADRVVTSDVAGNVHGLDKASGSVMWTQAGLARRDLSGVAIQGDYAVVGDLDGYLHWLRLSDGEMAVRERIGSKPVRAAPVVSDGILLAQNVDGDLVAFRLAQ